MYNLFYKTIITIRYGYIRCICFIVYTSPIDKNKKKLIKKSWLLGIIYDHLCNHIPFSVQGNNSFFINLTEKKNKKMLVYF